MYFLVYFFQAVFELWVSAGLFPGTKLPHPRSAQDIQGNNLEVQDTEVSRHSFLWISPWWKNSRDSAGCFLLNVTIVSDAPTLNKWLVFRTHWYLLMKRWNNLDLILSAFTASPSCSKHHTLSNWIHDSFLQFCKVQCLSNFINPMINLSYCDSMKNIEMILNLNYSIFFTI